MKRNIFFLAAMLIGWQSFAQVLTVPDNTAPNTAAQTYANEVYQNNQLPKKIQDINVPWLEERMNQMSDSIYVINFWATWCKPCVEELPYFNEMLDAFAGQNITILLVSADSKKQRDTKLQQFVDEKQIRPQVLWMNESNPDKWINLVNTGWSGAIPATIILRKEKNYVYFHEGEISRELLQQKIYEAILAKH